ncbi:hypothetical protein BASA83_000158 [Batrachochytrium salamandrivorans]|nr:hypothetical protein BASA83_000158 [Batrachochytrium salamandrivorans]
MSRSKSVVDNHIEEMKLNACLTSDAWSNIKNEPIVNYMLIFDSSAFFLESVSTEFAQQCKAVISFISFHHQMEAQTSKSTADREYIWLSAASFDAMGFLKGVFRKLKKK